MILEPCSTDCNHNGETKMNMRRHSTSDIRQPAFGRRCSPLRIVHSALCIPHSTLCIVHRALCIAPLAVFAATATAEVGGNAIRFGAFGVY